MSKFAETPDLESLLPSWQLHLRSERKSPETLENYTAGAVGYFRYCHSAGVPPTLSKPSVQAYMVHLLDTGRQATTAAARFRALRRFAAWLVEEGELETNPIIDARAPRLDVKITDALTDGQLSDLIKACSGRKLIDRRDEAIVRLMLETGMRAGEVVALEVADIDLTRGMVIVRRGKGFKARTAPFSTQTGAAIDRYIRLRTRAGFGPGPLWVGNSVKTLGYSGLSKQLKIRAAQAGIVGFHLHKMRHTAASRWLAAGGSEQGLMSVAGWSTRSMLDRYTRSSAADRAAAEARKLNLGDL